MQFNLQIHYIAELEFFTAFKDKHPNKLIQLMAFFNLKPWFVQHIKEWSTCCYRYHTKLVELCIGLNNMGSKSGGVHGHCPYRCINICSPLATQDVGQCSTHQTSFSQLSNLWNYILYEKLDDKDWHKRVCLMGDCISCGIETLMVCLIKQKENIKIVQWR